MKRSASLRAACLAAATALALVPSAQAARVSATGTVRGGGLTANALEGPIALSRSAADGQRRFFVPVTVTDARGTGEGWRLIVEADPDTGSGVRLLATGASATCASGTCTPPRDTVSYPVEVLGTAPSPATVFDAARTSGFGRFTITTTFSLALEPSSASIPAEVGLRFLTVSGP